MAPDSQKPRRRIACIDCKLIEPEIGTWVEGRCPRCNPGIRSDRHGRVKALEGERFGKLLVFSFAFSKKALTYWNCRCECGASIIRSCQFLRRSRNASCGCFKVERSRRNDLSGLVFGRLTVAEYAFTAKKRAFWRCSCECGQTCIVSANNLRHGITTSCGCFASSRRYRLGSEAGKKGAAIRRRNALKGKRPQFTRTSKITPAIALAIRTEYVNEKVTQRELAARYGVGVNTIGPLVRGETFKDVGGPLMKRRPGGRPA